MKILCSVAAFVTRNRIPKRIIESLKARKSRDLIQLILPDTQFFMQLFLAAEKMSFEVERIVVYMGGPIKKKHAYNISIFFYES